MAYFNRVKFTTATTGTGAVTVGSASSGFQTPASAGMLDGDIARYTIEDGTAWEIGVCTASSSSTVLSRAMEESSTAALLNLSGSAVMFFTPSAAKMAQHPTRGQVQAQATGTVSN